MGRQVAHTAKAAAQTVLAFQNEAHTMLRLSFGGAPNPPTWCAVSEMIADLSNKITLSKEWDPSALHNPMQSESPSPKHQPHETPIMPAGDMAFHIPTDVTARTDAFIDDLVQVFLDP